MANNDYLTITPPGSGATIYSFVYPAESGTTVAGSTITNNLALDSCTPYVRGGIPELRFHRQVGALAALPDPFDCASVSWSNGASHSEATTYFTGSVVGYTDRFDGDIGWVRDYRALGLRNLGDYVPVTDSNTLSDVARWDMPANQINTIPSREGRTVGQAVLELLSMHQNAAALQTYSIGAYSSAGSGAAAVATMSVSNTLSVYGTITAITLTSGGSGYGTTAPKVVIVGPCTTQATATCTVTGGIVNGPTLTITNAGAGYNSTPTVIISTLPLATITDLAALTIIPPFPLAFCGERILSVIESVIQTCHPNHWLYVLGDNAGSDLVGTIRILDQRATTNYTVTLGKPNSTTPPIPPDWQSSPNEPDGITYGDRWFMPQLHRDSSDTYSQLVVRGGPLVTGVYLSVLPQADTTMNANITAFGVGPVSTGGLFPDFVFGSYSTNATAEAQWAPSSFVQQSLQGGQDHGTINSGLTTTTSVVITSSNTALTLSSDQLDQSSTGLHAILTVIQSPVTGLQQMFSTSVIANTSMTAGGTSTLTVSPPLPALTYTSYFLTFSSQAGNVVWRRYVVVDSSGYGVSSKLGPALQQYFPYPFAYKNQSGTAAALTSAPVGAVLWSNGTSVSSTTWLNNGAAPWNESDFSITVDPSTGTITFPSPVNLVYGGGSISTPPSNIMVFVPVTTGVLSVTAPLSGYAGTLYSVDGVSRTKTITVRDWTQESGVNLNIQTYANEQFDSIKDVVVEGSISYLGLATPYLVPGYSISITGSGYTTGWETLQTSPAAAGLPISQAQVRFNWNASGTSYVTTLSLTNRRQRYSSEVYVRPSIRGQMLGGQFGAGYGAAWAQGMSQFAAAQSDIAGNTVAAMGEAGGAAAGAMGVTEGEAAIPQFGPAGQTLKEARAAEAERTGPASLRTPEQQAIDKDQARNAQLTRQRQFRREHPAEVMPGQPGQSPWEEMNVRPSTEEPQIVPERPARPEMPDQPFAPESGS